MTARTLLIALAVLAALPAQAAAAPPTIVDFEKVPNGAIIDDEYAPEVQFGTAAGFGLPSPPPGQGCPDGGQASTGGIAGTSNNIACTSSGEFPDRQFATAFEFGTERRDVRFKLQQRASDTPLNATLRVYGVGARLLDERPLSLPRNATVDVAATSSTQEIAAIVVFGDLADFQSGMILFDDLVAVLDDTPPPRKYSLALTTPSIEVIEGATATATVSIRRFNGSSGPVTFSVPELPPGIRATQFEPNPTSGRDPVKFRITADRPLSGQRQLTVQASGGASAGTGVGTQLVQTVTGIPAITISEGGRFTRTVAAGCGEQTFPEFFNVRGGFTGFVDLRSAPAGGLRARTSPSTRFAAADGLYPYDLVVDPGASTGINRVGLRVEPESATPAESVTSFRTVPVSVAAVLPNPVARPGRGAVGQIRVRGRFPDTCAIRMRDPLGQELKVLDKGTAEVDGNSLDEWTLELPNNAVSGPISVIAPAGNELARSAPLDVTEFRNVFALSQVNGGAGAGAPDYTWEEFERTFGTDDTDACFIFCVRDPIASDYYDQFRASVQSNGGLCSGYTQMALRFRGYDGGQSPAQYQPGATRAFQIAPTTDGTAVKRDVVRWQVAQNHKGFQEERTRALARSAADERTLIKQAVAQAGGAYIGIRQGMGGHAVVATAAQDISTASGPGLALSIYDPNVPFTTAETGSLTARTNAINQSTITIFGDGSWSGSSLGWSGLNGTLMATSLLPPTDATLPSSFSLASLFSSAGGPPPAVVTGIQAAGQEALGAGGEPRAGTGVTLLPVFSGAGERPEYKLEPGREYALKVRGTSAGRFAQGVVGEGASARVEGAATAPGQEDTVGVRPGQAQLAFAPGGSGGAVKYALTEKTGKVTRTASIATTARSGGDEAELTGSTLRLRHAGAATTATVTLGSVGEGVPGTVTTAPLKVGAGQRLELKPKSSKDLAAGVRLTVRDRRGRVVRRGTARLRTTGAVALAGVKARRSGRTVTVSGLVTKRGGAPVLAAVVEQVRGRRASGRRMVTRRGAQVAAGRFSLPVGVGRVRRGTRLRVTVTLLDEAAELASVRRQVTIR